MVRWGRNRGVRCAGCAVVCKLEMAGARVAVAWVAEQASCAAVQDGEGVCVCLYCASLLLNGCTPHTSDMSGNCNPTTLP